MRTKTLSAILASACVVALIGPAAAMSHKADEVKAFFEKAAGDFVACNTDTIGAYSTDAHTGYYPDSAQLVMEASEEAKQAAKEFCENGGKHELDYEIADVVMLTDAALVLGSGHYKRTEPDGTVSLDTDYNFTDVLVKTKDGWKFRHSHVAALMPEEEAVSE